MAQQCGFFNAELNGDVYDRVYLADMFAAYFASFIGNGVFGQSMRQLEVVSRDTNNMTVCVKSGQAWINGYWYRNTDDCILNFDIADGTLSRIDLVALRWDNSARDMYLFVIKGTASINPVAPEFEKDADYWDLVLAKVTIRAGAVSITQQDIEDTRLDNNYCGLVTGVVDQIDTTELYRQFTAYFNNFKIIYEADFDSWTQFQKQSYLDFVSQTEQDYTDYTQTEMQEYQDWYDTHTQLWTDQFTYWFENVKQTLSSDVAGMLQTQIDVIDEQIEGYINRTTQFSANGQEIIQTSDSGEKIRTTFVDKFNIVQEWLTEQDVLMKRKKIVFSSDGRTITETKEVI